MNIRVRVRGHGQGSKSTQTRDDQQLTLCVLPDTQLHQLRQLVSLKLAGRTPGASSLQRPHTAPAASVGHVASTLAAAANVENRSMGSSPKPEALQTPTSRLIFEGRLLGDEDDDRPLAELGMAEGAIVNCVVSPKASTAPRLECYPRSCTTDGGKVVRVAGMQVPSTARPACRFGTVSVSARTEDDGSEGGVGELSCIAPPHPAGPVTLSISFDAGTTWLEGPTFWFLDHSEGGCPYKIAVAASCRGIQGVRADANFGHSHWITRDGRDDRDPGAGCV